MRIPKSFRYRVPSPLARLQAIGVLFGVLLVLGSATSAAQAENRGGGGEDPADNGGDYLDIARFSVAYDNAAGVVTAIVRLQAPLPDPVPVGFYASVDLASDPEQGCGVFSTDGADLVYSQRDGAGFIPPGARRSDESVRPASAIVSGDRREVVITAQDSSLANRDWTCAVSRLFDFGAGNRGDDSSEVALLKPSGPLPPCGPSEKASSRLTAPAVIAYGRRGEATLGPASTLDPALFLNGRPVLGTRVALTAPRGAKQLQLSARWRQRFGPRRDSCLNTTSTRVRLNRGRAPTVASATRRRMFSIAFRRGACQRTAITPIAVRIRGEGRRRVIKTQDVCRAWSRRRNVRLPGVGVVVADGSEDDTPSVRILPRTYSKTRSYKLDVILGRKRVLRGRLVAKGFTVGPRRIYEGTDGFVNYCLNPDDPKRLRSADLRLYCNTTGYRRTRIRWQRGSR